MKTLLEIHKKYPMIPIDKIIDFCYQNGDRISLIEYFDLATEETSNWKLQKFNKFPVVHTFSFKDKQYSIHEHIKNKGKIYYGVLDENQKTVFELNLEKYKLKNIYWVIEIELFEKNQKALYSLDFVFPLMDFLRQNRKFKLINGDYLTRHGAFFWEKISKKMNGQILDLDDEQKYPLNSKSLKNSHNLVYLIESTPRVSRFLLILRNHQIEINIDTPYVFC